MRSQSRGTSYGGASIDMPKMDEKCRKDLPSPAKVKQSQDEPKSPPKSVRFTDEDAEVIDQSSTEKENQKRLSGIIRSGRRSSLKSAS